MWNPMLYHTDVKKKKRFIQACINANMWREKRREENTERCLSMNMNVHKYLKKDTSCILRRKNMHRSGSHLNLPTMLHSSIKTLKLR